MDAFVDIDIKWKMENGENIKFGTTTFDGLGSHLLGHLVQKDLVHPTLLRKNMGLHMTF